MRIEKEYRLGNIIDAWYGQEYTTRKACNFEIIVDLNSETFGNFLKCNKPAYLMTNPNEKFIYNATEWWWCYFMDNHITTYPYFTNSLRKAIDDFILINNQYKNLITPTTNKTCVVHFRVGDFLNHKETFKISSIINAFDNLDTTPDNIEVLNGGLHFRSDDIIKQKSLDIINELYTMIKNKFPNATVKLIHDSNADEDFFRMVYAPMLITGPGSFGIMAAAANKGYRLTPALKNLNFVDHGVEEPKHIYENWYTYA